MGVLHTGDYHLEFFSRHPDGSHLCNYVTRWWLECHEYRLDDQNLSVYGGRILSGPKRKPNLKKCILWTGSVHLIDSSCYIHGPFNIESRSNIALLL